VEFLVIIFHFYLKIADFSSATVGLFCLISGGLAFYCWDGALKKGDPRLIATLSYFTPLLSTGLLIVFNKKPIIIYSFVLIVGGAMITAKSNKR